MTKLYVLGRYDCENYNMGDLIEDRCYFVDADKALQHVRECVMSHLEQLHQDDYEILGPLDAYSDEDFHKWMAEHHPDLWYPTTEADLSGYDGLFGTFFYADRESYWFMTENI